MKQHRKRFAVLVLAQALCLALGLWLEHRFALSAAEAAARGSQPAGVAGAKEGASPGASDLPAKRATAAQETPLAIRAMAFFWIAALQAVVAYLVLSRAQEETSRTQNRAERVSVERYNDLLRTRDAVIFGLAKLAESRDSDTGNHLERIARYSTRLASALRRNPQYRRHVTPQFVKLIGISSSLHDIGKVGIADSILLKPGKFDDCERQTMRHHATIGGKCIRDIESRLGRSNFLQMAREIAFAHHERWDGTGYPRGLAGEEIPLAARIVAVADVYDALSSKRVYKEAIPHAQCVETIKDGAGTHFDPAIVAAFLEIEAEFHEIVRRNAESAEARLAGPAGDDPTAEADAESSIDGNLADVMDLLDQCIGESLDTACPSARESRSAQLGGDGARPLAATSILKYGSTSSEREPEHAS